MQRAEQVRGVESHSTKTRGESAIPPYLRAVVSLSPRTTCRVDAAGDHRYQDAALPTDFPQTPWALYLTDNDHNFRLLGIDLDDHNGDRGADVACDLALLLAVCDDLELDYLVCASGAGNGRHLWLRCTPTPALTIDRIRHALQVLCPTFDPAPLANISHGCLRAPGSRHRDGSTSTPLPHGAHLTGLHAIRALGSRATSSAQMSRLADRLAELAGGCTSRRSKPARRAAASTAAAPRPHRSPIAPTGSTGSGPHFSRRPLAGFATNLLACAPGVDASRTSHTIARSFVYAGQSVDDFLHAALVDRAPGLEHIRTVRRGDTRIDRRGAHDHAVRQFEKAVQSIPEHHLAPAGDLSPRTRERLEEVTDIAHTAVTVAWRAAGWTGPSGLVLLRTLMALAKVSIERGRRTVTLGARDWALRAGLTVAHISPAARALEKAGWIECVSPARGPLAGQWQITERSTAREHLQQFLITGGTHPPLHPAATPGQAPAPLLLQHLSDTGCDPAWQLPGLGTTGHAIWGLLQLTGGCSEAVLAGTLGLDRRTVSSTIEALSRHGLARGAGGGLVRARSLDRCRAACAHGGQDRVLAERADRYARESALWAIRCAERVWRTSAVKSSLPTEISRLRRVGVADGPALGIESSYPNLRGLPTRDVLVLARAWCRRLDGGQDLTVAEKALLGVVELPSRGGPPEGPPLTMAA